MTRAELERALGQAAVEPAEGGSASGAPLLGLIVANQSYNRYTVQLATDGGPGQPPEPIEGEQVLAINLLEPFDQTGELEADTPVLLWPSQGLYLFCQAAPAEEPPAGPLSYWARVLSGGGPGYTVRRQIASGDDGFTDAEGAQDVSAANVWELTVDAEATANVPADAIVRVWEEPDSGETLQRFFFYPIHAVYR